jgi:hypothetical protein
MNPTQDTEAEDEVPPMANIGSFKKTNSKQMQNRASSKQLQRELSITSKRYDVGNKGYLDEEEQILRAYDTNGDGELDLVELKKIVGDLRSEQWQGRMLKKFLAGAAVCAVLVVLANFGLVWATVSLTNQVGTQSGSLVDAHTGEKISTRVGQSFTANVNPGYVRRYLRIKARRVLAETTSDTSFNWKDEIRRLNEETNVATLDQDSTQTEEMFNEYVQGTATTVTINVGVKLYTGIVGSGVTHTSSDGCEIYDGVVEQGTTEPTFKLTCCGTANCDVFQTAGRWIGVYRD